MQQKNRDKSSLIERTALHAGTLLLSSFLVLSLSGCSFNSNGSAGGTGTTNAGNFTTTVFIGDSLTAGFQNGSLLDTQQPHGYANQIAKQAKFSLALPLIAPPGAPAVLKLISVGPPPVIQQSSGITTGRDDLTLQATDLAVPGALLHDVLNTAPVALPTTNEEIITELVLGIPGLALGQDLTQTQWAIRLKPTTIFVWAGNNDALVADSAGTPSVMTPLASFTADYTQLMTTLSQKTTAHLIVANIPDVTEVPYLTPAATVIAEGAAQTGLSAAVVSQMLGIQAGDLVNPTGIAEVTPILTKQQAGPMTDAGFLSTAEIAQVQQMVTSYNQVIQQQAQAVGATLVDIHALFAKTVTAGIVINGYTANFGFLGGLFGLDGVHPTNTGYALLANTFIDAMNTGIKTTIPDINLGTVAAADPLFPPNLPKATRRLRQTPLHITSSAGKSLDWMFRVRTTPK